MFQLRCENSFCQCLGQGSALQVWHLDKSPSLIDTPCPPNPQIRVSNSLDTSLGRSQEKWGHFWRDKAELCVTLEHPVNGPTDPNQAAEAVAERTDKTVSRPRVESADPASLWDASPLLQNCCSLQGRLSLCQQSLWQSLAVGSVPVARICPKKQLPLGCVAAHSSTLGSNQPQMTPSLVVLGLPGAGLGE